MADAAARVATVEGHLDGPVTLTGESVVWGDLVLTTEGERVRFSAQVPLLPSGEPPDVKDAVAAAVAAATGVGVKAFVEGMSWPNDDGTVRWVTSLNMSWNVNQPLAAEADTAGIGAQVFRASLADERLAHLFEVYVLGARAVQTIAPVVGLWAFTVILEEEARNTDKPNLKHLTELVERLRAAGHDVQVPDREPNRVRAAALHPTPDDLPPTSDEVRAFQRLARAYLLDRAARAASLPG